MFLDSSVVAAVLLQEDDSPTLLKAMEAARGKLRFSPIVRMEAVLALVRRRVENRGQGSATAEDFALASELVTDFIVALDAKEMHITTSMGEEAIRALAIYGKMVGHPAKLNMGDALSYACAKAFHVPLLYRGHDLAETDLA